MAYFYSAATPRSRGMLWPSIPLPFSLRFALEHARVFALYLRTSGSADGNPQCTNNVQFFLEIVGRVYGEARAWDASHALWALLHGIAVLRDAGVLGKAQASSALKFGLTTWIEAADRAH